MDESILGGEDEEHDDLDEEPTNSPSPNLIPTFKSRNMYKQS